MSGVCKVRNLIIGEGIPKICVPIVSITKEEIIREVINIKEKEPDLVEWRVDFFENIENREKTGEVLEKIRELLGGIPLLFTFRTKKEGGEREVLPEKYIEINKAAIESGCIDLVDVEAFMAKEAVEDIVGFAKNSGVKVVGSNHNFTETPTAEEIVKRLKKMDLYGCDIVKIALMPKEKNDVMRVLQATVTANENINKPVITMSMGRLGAISRMIGESTGSAVTFASVNKASAPGQVEISALRNILQQINKVGV